MNFVNTHKRLHTIKVAYYEWFRNTTWVTKLSMSLGLALATGIAAQIRIPLPFTPVPVTAQVLTVLLAGILLGSYYGSISMLLYLVIGFAGIPWFANATTGLPIGPTTGYIVGFIPAALFIGSITTRYRPAKGLLALTGLMIGAVGIIYLCGALNFAFFMGTNLNHTLAMAVLPFIPFDIVKAFIAALFARAVLPSDPPSA